jgi:hypothetical protein
MILPSYQQAYWQTPAATSSQIVCPDRVVALIMRFAAPVVSSLHVGAQTCKKYLGTRKASPSIALCNDDEIAHDRSGTPKVFWML